MLFEWINDRECVLFNSAYRPIDQTDHRQWFEGVRGRNDMVMFGIRLLADGRLIGTCQLHTIHPVHRSAELQIRIGNPTDRGHGYGGEALRLLLDHGFQDLNLHRIDLHVLASNAVAIAAYKKAGFIREGLLRQCVHIGGQYQDLLLMGILRDEYVRQ